MAEKIQLRGWLLNVYKQGNDNYFASFSLSQGKDGARGFTLYDFPISKKAFDEYLPLINKETVKSQFPTELVILSGELEAKLEDTDQN